MANFCNSFGMQMAFHGLGKFDIDVDSPENADLFSMLSIVAPLQSKASICTYGKACRTLAETPLQLPKAAMFHSAMAAWPDGNALWSTAIFNLIQSKNQLNTRTIFVAGSPRLRGSKRYNLMATFDDALAVLRSGLPALLGSYACTSKNRDYRRSSVNIMQKNAQQVTSSSLCLELERGRRRTA